MISMTRALQRIRHLERDRELLIEVASPQGRAVIRAVMRHYELVLRIAFGGDLRAYLASVESCPQWASVVRACARLERKREKKS